MSPIFLTRTVLKLQILENDTVRQVRNFLITEGSVQTLQLRNSQHCNTVVRSSVRGYTVDMCVSHTEL